MAENSDDALILPTHEPLDYHGLVGDCFVKDNIFDSKWQWILQIGTLGNKVKMVDIKRILHDINTIEGTI